MSAEQTAGQFMSGLPRRAVWHVRDGLDVNLIPRVWDAANV